LESGQLLYLEFSDVRGRRFGSSSPRLSADEAWATAVDDLRPIIESPERSQVMPEPELLYVSMRSMEFGVMWQVLVVDGIDSFNSRWVLIDVVTGALRYVAPAAFDTMIPNRIAFIRGDAHEDGRVNLSDAIAILRRLFIAADRTECLDLSDANGDLRIDLQDPVHLLGHLFGGGPRPPEPFHTCSATLEGIGCSCYSACPP
jgi:hypothetical protein